MLVENQVSSLGQSKKLFELGIKGMAHSQYDWVAYSLEVGVEFALSRPMLQGDKDWLIVQSKVSKEVQLLLDDDCLNVDGRIYPAFTVAELGVMLPSELYTEYTGSSPSKNAPWQWVDFHDDTAMGTYDTEAIARAGLLIQLLENKNITPAEVNDRLINA